LYVTRSDDHYKGTFLFENNIVASSGKNGINFDGTPSGGAIVRYNTLYRNGAFDFIQTEHVGPNKVAGVAAKHVGFLNVYNNVIVCRGDEYSAFSVWDASPTDVQHNMLVNCSVQLASGDANRTSTTSAVFRDGSETYVTRQDLETRFELKSLGIDIASSAYISSEDFRGTSRPYGNGYDMGAIESSRCVIPDTDTLKTYVHLTHFTVTHIHTHDIHIHRYVEEVNNGTQYEISDPVCAVKDISDWITDDLTSLEDVFRSMNQIGNVDLSRWNVAKVTTMFYTFYDATSFNGNLSNWNTNKVKNLAQTFRGATAFKGTGLKDWNAASVTTLESTFRSSGLTEDVGVWNVENARSIARTFYNARDFHSDTIGSWNVQNVNTLMSTFRGASSFNGDLSSWIVTSTLTNMQHTFRDASLFEGDGIGSWDTSSVTVMKYAFEGAAQFNGDIESWDVENVTNFNYMFENAMSFDRNISVWNVNAGSSTTLMFDGDVGLSECVRANIYDAWFERGVEILSFATSSCTSPTTTTTTEAATTTSTEAATTTTSTEAATTTSTEALSTTSTEPVSTTSTEVVSTTSTEDVSTTSTEDVSTTSTEAVSTTSTEAVSTTSTEVATTTSTEAVSTTSTEVATTSSTEAATTTGTEAISTTSTEAVSTTSSIVTESESSEDTIMVAIGMYAGIGIGALLLICLSYLCFCSTKREKKTIHTPRKKGSFDGDSNLWATHNSDNDVLAAPYEL
jgi:surface protein